MICVACTQVLWEFAEILKDNPFIPLRKGPVCMIE